MSKSKSLIPIIGIQVAEFAKMGDDGSSVLIEKDEWKPSQHFVPSRNGRFICNITGETINLVVAADVPKKPKIERKPPPGDRIKKGGKGEGKELTDNPESSNNYYYEGPPEELCSYSSNGVFKLNRNHSFVKRYFTKPTNFATHSSGHKLRLKLCGYLHKLAKNMSTIFRESGLRSEIEPDFDDHAFINKVMNVQVTECPLVRQLCDKLELRE